LLTLERFHDQLERVVGLGALDNDTVRVSNELGIQYYVNTGFLYLNLVRAREINFAEKVLRRCDSRVFSDTGHDQRGINQAFSGTEILPVLDQTWNIQTPSPEALESVPRGARILHITGPFKPWNYTCASIWWEAFQAYLPANFYAQREMPSNAIQCVFVGNVLVRQGELLLALFFFRLALEQARVNMGHDPRIEEVIKELSFTLLNCTFQNKTSTAVTAHQEFFEKLLGISRDEWNPYRYRGIL
jgi:lipopolysaccharide biosynthesis glycosyltransferase